MSLLLYYLQSVIYFKKIMKIAKLNYLGAIFQSCIFCFKGLKVSHTIAEVEFWHLTDDRKKPNRLMLSTKRVNNSMYILI